MFSLFPVFRVSLISLSLGPGDYWSFANTFAIVTFQRKRQNKKPPQKRRMDRDKGEKRIKKEINSVCENGAVLSKTFRSEKLMMRKNSMEYHKKRRTKRHFTGHRSRDVMENSVPSITGCVLLS